MDVDTLSNLLGKHSTNSHVEAALQRFGVTRRPELVIDPADADGPVVKSQDWVSNLSAGIEFGFQEEGAFMGLDQADRGVGPMILTEVYFYGDRPGARPYPLPLPFGLLLSDSRSVVRAKMAPLEKTRRSYVRDTWEHPAFRLTVSYADGGTRVDFLVCMLRTEALEPLEGGQILLPSVAAMTGVLGKSMDDPALRQTFVPLGLDRQTLVVGTKPVIDFRRTYGLKLDFRKSPAADKVSAKALLLHEIELLGKGELESRGWLGDLPFGIRFDDSPETALGRVGQAPTHQENQDFSGQAFWELPDYSLQVAYSTMENIVLRVCIFATSV